MPESSITSSLFVVVLTDGTRLSFEPFEPKAVNLIKVNLGTPEDYEGIWACLSDEGAALLRDPSQADGQWMPLTLRNHAACWMGLPSWGMVLPVRITRTPGRLMVDLRLIDFPATCAANGGQPPFLLTPTSEDPQ